jgi:hypothetical protein
MTDLIIRGLCGVAIGLSFGNSISQAIIDDENKSLVIHLIGLAAWFVYIFTR